MKESIKEVLLGSLVGLLFALFFIGACRGWF